LLLLDEGAQLTGDQLGLIAALAARDAVISCTEVRPTIKWPNDLVVGDRKLGGVLVESRSHGRGTRAYVIGMGINCLQQRPHLSPELSLQATSLEIESRLSVDRTQLAIALLNALDDWLAEPASWDSSQLRDRWLSAAQPLGKRVRVQQAGKAYEGSIIDVDPQAALLIMLDSGSIRAFNAADTTVVWQEDGASP
jgi:BirA family biotin operon repressor/biotin-[acetyl-CoA-carboxylase] ligase